MAILKLKIPKNKLSKYSQFWVQVSDKDTSDKDDSSTSDSESTISEYDSESILSSDAESEESEQSECTDSESDSNDTGEDIADLVEETRQLRIELDEKRDELCKLLKNYIIAKIDYFQLEEKFQFSYATLQHLKNISK